MASIDSDALVQRLKASPIFANFGTDGLFIRDAVIDIISKQPVTAADGVNVVRCKGCKTLRKDENK